jgi:two-component system, sporulation sensor kinase E
MFKEMLIFKDLYISKTKKRILCVEDHPDTCELITTILKKYDCTSAYSKADALALATKEKFDLYLLDYHLPDGTGIELCLLIKNFDTKTPMLFVTGTSSMTQNQAIKVGAQGLVKKAADNFIKDLEEKVSELLDKK